MQTEIKKLLENVKNGTVTVDDALLTLKTEPFADLGYAKVDLHRAVRQGHPEVIYGESKTAAQISGIIGAMKEHGQERVLITRLSPQKAELLSESIPITYNETAGTAWTGVFPEPDGIGEIVVACGGTSDIPVAQEAALTAEFFGNKTCRLYDIGVAGLHRLLSNSNIIMRASVIIAVAGMEGALASVVGGLADCPVIAVPTSVGYGASFGGIAALLSMLNSCASGVSVVNIDNGFGAGYLAGMINHMEVKK
ncbi:MAG: nickel pincer cofactor biosynthesis protein LarB [Clostridia bacterium]|nr:nickel pincer cofactor biosynthesis protein LarB [Clostridia bacterium]